MKQIPFKGADPQPYLDIIGKKEFKSNFEFMDNRLKTAPKGYPKDFEHIDLIRYKSFVPFKNFSDEDFCADDFEDNITRHLKMMQPYNAYLNEIIE